MFLPQLSHNPSTWVPGTVAQRPAHQANACTLRSSMAALGLPFLRFQGEPQPLSYTPTTEVSALGHPHCTLADHSPVPPPRPSPTLGTALWGSCQGPISGFLHTASNRAGEVASWRSSLPSTFLPPPSSFLPQPFARPTLASGKKRWGCAGLRELGVG